MSQTGRPPATSFARPVCPPFLGGERVRMPLQRDRSARVATYLPLDVADELARRAANSGRTVSGCAARLFELPGDRRRRSPSRPAAQARPPCRRRHGDGAPRLVLAAIHPLCVGRARATLVPCGRRRRGRRAGRRLGSASSRWTATPPPCPVSMSGRWTASETARSAVRRRPCEATFRTSGIARGKG